MGHCSLSPLRFHSILKFWHFLKGCGVLLFLCWRLCCICWPLVSIRSLIVLWEIFGSASFYLCQIKGFSNCSGLGIIYAIVPCVLGVDGLFMPSDKLSLPKSFSFWVSDETQYCNLYHLKKFYINSTSIEGETGLGSLPEHPPFHPGKKGFLSFDLRQQCPLRAQKHFVSWGGAIDV
ncbi:hypothetical protein AAHA92_22114 [Salvia divinorum]|uniref:Uncharacterized protein n=1 Tax=Salvia divinorum TaxID=28513 RepID=A0ABD1GQI4_SALDI